MMTRKKTRAEREAKTSQLNRLFRHKIPTSVWPTRTYSGCRPPTKPSDAVWKKPVWLCSSSIFQTVHFWCFIGLKIASERLFPSNSCEKSRVPFFFCFLESSSFLDTILFLRLDAVELHIYVYVIWFEI